MTLRSRVWELAIGLADSLVVGPVRAYVDDRITRLEGRITMASSGLSERVERLARINVEGFAAVRSHLTAEIERARREGNTESQENLANLDAGLDALAAGFAGFVSAPEVPVEPSGDTVPPVVNPDTPDPAETVPDVHDSLPVNPVEVVNDPAVATPNDAGSDSSQVPETQSDAGSGAGGVGDNGGGTQGAQPEQGQAAGGGADAGGVGGGDPVVSQAGNVNAANAGQQNAASQDSANAADGPATA